MQKQPAKSDIKRRTLRKVPRGARRRLELAEVAERTFLEHGFSDTTMQMIASRAGGSKETLYRHFANKEALFAEIVGRRAMAVTGPESALARDGAPEAVLLELGVNLLTLMATTDSLSLFRLVVAEAPRAPELAAVFCVLYRILLVIVGLRLGKVCLGIGELRLGLLQLRREILARDLRAVLLTLILRFGRRQRPFRLLAVGLVLPGIDMDQRLPLLDELVVGDIERDDDAGHLRGDADRAPISIGVVGAFQVSRGEPVIQAAHQQQRHHHDADGDD